MANRSIASNRILLTLIVIFSIIPDLGIKISTWGFNWTIYRLVVIASTIIIVRIEGIDLKIMIQSFSFRWFLFLTFWIIYGLLLTIISPYADLHNSFVELLSLLNGALTFLIINYLINNEDDILWIEFIIYLIFNFLIIFAFCEIITGKHLHTSAFYDANSGFFMYNNYKLATGFMYNVNDFSALLTCLSPILLVKRWGIGRYITLAGLIIVNLINDASICNMALLVSLTYVFLIIKGKNAVVTSIKRALFIAIVVFFIMYIVSLGVYGLSEQKGILGAVSNQVINYKNSSGSLFVRFNVYKEAIKGWIDSGFFGVGPKGFSKYFIENVNTTNIINPHALLLEILLEYGIVVFTIFAVLIILMFRESNKLYKKYMLVCNNYEYLVIMAFIVVYLIASFAPSAFIGYSYQWLLLALMCVKLDVTMNDNIRRDIYD